MFFATISSRNYRLYYTNEDLVHGNPLNETSLWPWASVMTTDIQSRLHAFKNLTNLECINAYASDFVTVQRDVILVVESPKVDHDGGLVDDYGTPLFPRSAYTPDVPFETDDDPTSVPKNGNNIVSPSILSEQFYNDTSDTYGNYDLPSSISASERLNNRNYKGLLYAFGLYEMDGQSPGRE